MSHTLERTLGGGLRPGDPRRYLVEAMVGAMNADGHVDPREMQVLRGHIARHELFSGLPPQAADLLVEMASDAVHHSDDGRVRAIARGLPTRTHRLAAYAMAAEICVADEHFHDGELQYLRALERRLRLDTTEAKDLFEGAWHGRAMTVLGEKFARLRQLMPLVVDFLALQHCLERRVLERHQKRLGDFLTRLVDMHASEADIRATVEKALDPLEHTRNVKYWLKRLASRVPHPADRYWLAVYLAAAYRYRAIEEWQELPFVELACLAFAIPKLDAVADHASKLIEPRAPRRRHERLRL